MNTQIVVVAQGGPRSLWWVLAVVGWVLGQPAWVGHAAPGHGWGRHYAGGYHRQAMAGHYYGSHYHRPYGYNFTRFFPGYTYAYPRFFSYGYHHPYGSYGYYHPGYFPYRTYPRDEPRIYVYPQRSSSRSLYPSPRWIMIYSTDDPVLSDIPPDHTLDPIPDEAGIVPPPEPPPVDPEKAWDYLDSGLMRKALRAFSLLATTHPDQGTPKLGFGLAAALLDDNISASHGFRRAFETDPEGSSKAPISDVLRVKLDHLKMTYERKLERCPDELNIGFLHGAVCYLLGSNSAAKQSLEKARAAGDTSASNVRLMKLVDQELSAQPPPPETGRKES